LEHPSSFSRVGYLLATWEWPGSLENGRDGLTWDQALSEEIEASSKAFTLTIKAILYKIYVDELMICLIVLKTRSGMALREKNGFFNT
jgi:hypothetical protein